MTDTPQRTAFITGASKRIGRALALGLANQGWNIAIHYSSSEQDAKSLAEEIGQIGPRCCLIQADLNNAERVEALIGEACEELGPLHALINNASGFERDTIEEFSIDSWDSHLNTNLRAPAILIRDFLKQAAKGANIINIIDQRVWRLTPDFMSYTLSKTALWSLTQTTAQAVAPRGIRCNAIGPGPTLPNPRQERSEFDKQASLVPLGHGATPDDILQAVLYIFSASAMTGQMIALDGGQHLAWQTPDVTQVKE
ncbi:SDR family oxidoreductase [Alphaproteobacteria bacterium]|jgi:NAD(P)-dependent dehydrogenase (short-subunit alcohol dehydrogenase family)|nr:SDR family oxidoreductase [Alphaproteobacteria bacterium]